MSSESPTFRVTEFPDRPQYKASLPSLVWSEYPFTDQEGHVELRRRVTIPEGDKNFDFQFTINGVDLNNPAHTGFVSVELDRFLTEIFGNEPGDRVRFGPPLDKDALKLYGDQYFEKDKFPYVDTQRSLGLYVDTTGYKPKVSDGNFRTQLEYRLSSLGHLGTGEAYAGISSQLSSLAETITSS